jgi:membrane fusion protein (multidrug efflux system)
MKIKFSMSNSEKLYEATVMATEEGINDATRNLKVRAIVNSQSDELLAGGFANVQLRMNENKNALMIPSQSIIPQEDKKLVIVARDGKAKLIQVKTGIRKASMVEITDGIITGDTIVTSGIMFIKEGSKLSYSSVTN